MIHKRNNKTVGTAGENIAAQYLIKQNYKILFRNWKYSYLEVDIIAYDKDFLVFVEVKARVSNVYGLPQEALDNKKIDNLLKAADSYIYDNNYKGNVRFDIIAINFNYTLKSYHLKHIKDAFF